MLHTLRKLFMGKRLRLNALPTARQRVAVVGKHVHSSTRLDIAISARLVSLDSGYCTTSPRSGIGLSGVQEDTASGGRIPEREPT